jgi:predicted nuclease of predicted toxin-antitoxin system
MKLLVDMNLSPDWAPLLNSRGWEAVHWSSLGKGNESDPELLAWARVNNHIVMTQDLDFSQILYATAASGPSVVLLRMDNEFDPAAKRHVCAALSQAEEALTKGALLTISSKRARLRRLPIDPCK